MSMDPPIGSVPLAWRDLYRAGCFFQRELTDAATLRRDGAARDWKFITLGDGTWREWDAGGVLRPLAFASAPYISGMTAPAVPEDELVFTDEIDGPKSWDDFGVEVDGFTSVMAKYSPWQNLQLPTAVDGDGPPHAAFEPLLKALVRLQGRYWPDVYGRVKLLSALDGRHYDPLERDAFDADAVRTDLALSAEDVADTYYWLAFRGAEDYGDGLALLRQALPRGRRQAFKGVARRRQDFLDAAEIFRRFHLDLTGEVLPDPDIVRREHGAPEAMAHSQAYRTKDLGHDTRLRFDADDVRRMLIAVGIYPHQIHAVVEGDSEERMIHDIVEATLGPVIAGDMTITNLDGVGNVRRAEALLATIADYVTGSVLIIDNEGEAAEVVARLIAAGQIDRDDVLRMENSLEEDNFTPDELVAAAKQMATRDGVDLLLTANELIAFHQKQIETQNERPGLATCLVRMARDPRRGTATVPKPELAAVLAEQMLNELEAAKSDKEREAVFDQRPVLKFILERIVEPLAQQPLDRPRRPQRP